MTSKTITINHFQIAYLEVNHECTKTIFFLHGNSGSSNAWLAQLNDPLFKNYRMIAFDLPAHGNSAASTNPDEDYSLLALGELIAGAINKLASKDGFIMVGCSLGSNVLAESLNWIKPDGAVLVSSSVAGGDYTMEKIFQPEIDTEVFFTDSASAEKIDNFASAISYSPSEADKKIAFEDYKRVRSGFRPALIKTVLEDKLSNEIELLVQFTTPVFVIFGLDDKMANPHYLNDAPFNLWKNKVFHLAEAAHTAHIDQLAIFNKLLFEYVTEIFG